MAGTELIKADSLNIAALAQDSETAELMREALAGESLGLGDFERVKWPTGGGTKFERSILGNDESVSEIVGVIVHQGMSRRYWKDADPKEGTPPDCKSPDATYGYGDPGDALRASSPEPLGCEVCPNSKFGSGKDNAQACKLTRDFAILPQGGGVLPLLVSVPPASLGNARSYVVGLAEFGIRYYGALTKLSLKKATSSGGQAYAEAQLAMIGRLDDEAFEKVTAYRESIAETFAQRAPDDAPGDTATAAA